jgi:YggT family protein
VISLLWCNLATVLNYIVWIYSFVLLAYAVVSWIPDLRSSRFAYYLARLVEPVLTPVRRIIPPVGGLDLAFLVVLLVLQLLIRPALTSLAFNACIPMQ